MILALLSLPLFVAIFASWTLSRGPVAILPRLCVGTGCLVTAAFVQSISFSLPFHDMWPAVYSFIRQLFNSLGISMSAPYLINFVQPSRLLPWLLNVMALIGIALVWLAVRLPIQRTAMPDNRFLIQWFRGQALRSFYFSILGTFWLVVVLCVYVRPYLVAQSRDWFGFTAAPLDGIFWFGPIAFAALVAGAARPVAAQVTEDDDLDAIPLSRQPNIDRLLEHIDRTYGALVWHGPVEIADDRRSDQDTNGRSDSMVERTFSRLAAQVVVPPEDLTRVRSALTQGFANFWNDSPQPPGSAPWKPWNVLIPEELAKAHLAVLAELIQSCHDHGGVVLVIAPSWTLGRVRRALEAAGEKDWTDITQRWVDLTEGPLDSAQQYNVVFASDEVLEPRLLSRAQKDPGVQRVLTMLRMVVVLDFHLLEAAMLRLRLRRLRWLTQEQTVRVVCQSEYRESLLTAVGNTFAPLTANRFQAFEVAVTHPATRHLVVWNNDWPTLEALFEHEHEGVPDQPIELAPLLARMARKSDFQVEPAFIDAAGRWDQAVWDRLIPGFISTSVSNYPGRDVLCMIVEDRGNLIDAVLQYRNYHGVDKYILMVVSRRYALRDWFLSLLKENDKFLNPLRPIAPDPQGGLTEVAMILAAEFQFSARPVPQSKVISLFEEVKPATAEAFGLFPTQAGLDRLFKRVNGPEQGLSTEPKPDRHHDINFVRPPGIPAPREPLLSIATEEAPGLHLAPGDHGLRYAQGTTLHNGGRVYQISQVDIDHRQKIRATNAQAALPSRTSYLFHRQYAVSFEPGHVVLETGGQLQNNAVVGIDHRRAALRGEIDRLTGAIAPIDETSTSPITAPWRATDIRATPRHVAMLLWRLELSELQADSNLLGGDRAAATAFTLAATLQDVLSSLFPTHAHRIAVVSPQAGPCVNAAIQPMDAATDAQIERFPIDFYPRLVERLPPKSTNRPRNNPAIDAASVERAITAMLAGAGRTDATEDPDAPRQILDLLVIEDSDHDLGVVHALDNDRTWANVVAVWTRFTYWLGAEDGISAAHTRYHRFGGSSLASCFAFREASRAVSTFAPRYDGMSVP